MRLDDPADLRGVRQPDHRERPAVIMPRRADRRQHGERPRALRRHVSKQPARSEGSVAAERATARCAAALREPSSPSRRSEDGDAGSPDIGELHVTRLTTPGHNRTLVAFSVQAPNRTDLGPLDRLFLFVDTDRDRRTGCAPYGAEIAYGIRGFEGPDVGTTRPLRSRRARLRRPAGVVPRALRRGRATSTGWSHPRAIWAPPRSTSGSTRGASGSGSSSRRRRPGRCEPVLLPDLRTRWRSRAAVAMTAKATPPPAERATKACPYCAETIRA